MGKTKRKWIVLDYNDSDALRAEDIPLNANESIGSKIDGLSAEYVSLSGAQSVSGTKTFIDQTIIENSLIQHNLAFPNIVAGDYSHAEGRETSAVGNYSHAEGDTTVAEGWYSHAEGVDSEANGFGSHAEGEGTRANGSSSHAEGESSYTQGSASHTEGRLTSAIGNYSHSEGGFTKSFGIYSHAEGIGTVAQGSYSHAEGNNTYSHGTYSHTEGNYTSAYGSHSHAEGHGTITNQDYQHVGGEYNVSDVNVTSAYYPYIVGNGSSDANRSDAFAVRMTGEIKHGGRPNDHVLGGHGGITHFGSLSSNPTPLSAGDRYFNNVSNHERYWNGTSWIAPAESLDSASPFKGFGSQFGSYRVDASTGIAEYGLCAGMTITGGFGSLTTLSGEGFYRPMPGNGSDQFYTPQIFGIRSNIRALYKMRWLENTNTSSDGIFIGFTTITHSSVAGLNNPTGSHFGMQFRRSRDTNLQFMTKDGSTQNLTDTGIAPTINDIYYFEFTCNRLTPSATMTMYDSDRAVLGTWTHTTNIPAVGTIMRLGYGSRFESQGLFYMNAEVE